MDEDHPMHRPPNGPAYSRDEARHGPPLSYVGEKLRSALEEIHSVVRDLAALATSPRSTVREDLSFHARTAFGYQLTAFLALYNMLGSRSDSKTDERMLAMDAGEFSRWLDFVEREGSTSGA